MYIFPKVVYANQPTHFPPSIGAGNAAERMAYVNTATLHRPGKVEESPRPRQEINRALDTAEWLSKPGPRHPAPQSLSSLVTINPPQTNRNPICSNK